MRARPTGVEGPSIRCSCSRRRDRTLAPDAAVDALRLGLDALLLLATALLSQIADDLDRSLSAFLGDFPEFLKVFWLGGFWGAVGWSLSLLLITAFRRRARLTLEAMLGALVAVGVTVIAAAIVTGHPGDPMRALFDSNGPPVFPPVTPAITAAVITVMAPYLTVPFRRVGRGFIAAQLVGALFLGVSQMFGTVASLAIGLLAGNLIHLLRGSPGGLPTTTRVRAALHDLGVEADGVRPTQIGREGVAVFEGTDAHGPVEVRVYGRDAWEGELAASMWRLAWYRGSQRTARLSRSEYVEHEGFMTYLASSAGVNVPEVVTAGLAENGDALIVVRPNGATLRQTTPKLTADQAQSLWAQLSRLHDRGISHRRIDLDRVVTRPDGFAGFSDLSSATVESDPVSKASDRAQLLGLTLLAMDEAAALAQGRRALGDEGLTAVLPYLQAATLPPLVRSGLHDKRVDVDKARKAFVGEVGASDVELVRVRRVTWKSLMNLALLAVAAYTIIGMLSGLDLEGFWRDLRAANWWWLAAALLIGQLPRPANALSTMGSTQQPLPFGPTTAMQFATCYVNLAVPSSAGRIALTTRFYQRFGVPAASALSASAIDSISEFVIQVVLFVSVFFVSDIDLGLSLDTDQLSGLATIVLIALFVIVIGGLITLLVPSLRKRVKVALGQAREALQVLKSPRKLVQLYCGNLLSQLLFAVTLGAVVRGFGYHVPLSALILINTTVSLFAGLLPVPGGVGVSEAGLSLGLTRAGIPAETAFAIALAYRFCTFYLPPIWGYVSYRWLTSKRYL